MIRGRRIVFSTPWLEVEAKDTDLDADPFYSLKLADYVAVVAVTTEGRMILVRQFRPAVEQETLELPSGLVDSAESPEAAALRELEEETGYTVPRLYHLGTLFPDTGRLQNRLWCYLARDATRIPAWSGESGMEVVLMTPDEVTRAIRDGVFTHALHVAALYLRGSTSAGASMLSFGTFD